MAPSFAFVATAAVVAFVAGLASADCSGAMPAATTTWKTTCQNLTSLGTDDCWTNGRPDINSTVVFPAGTNATMGTWFNWTYAEPYVVFRAANIHIETGAVVNMTGDAIEVTTCFQVDGELNLLAQRSDMSQAPIGEFLPDPAQPFGTDCRKVNVGFTPRVCGPGKLLVNGKVLVSVGYASMFLGATVNTGATFTLDSAFFWGELRNNGTYKSIGYSYQHGMLINSGSATIGTIAFDKWATAFIANTENPLLIRNSGQLDFNGDGIYPTQAQYWTNNGPGSGGVYRVAVINDAYLKVSAWTAPFGADFYNLGTMEWFPNDFYNFDGEGTFVNRGTMIANGAYVFLNTLQSLGGTLVQKNGGSFEITNGSPNAASRATMRLCTLVTGMPSALQAEYKRNVRRLELARRHLHHNEANLVTFKDGCTWYCGHCYQTPYDVFPPTALRLAGGDGANGQAPTTPRAVDPTGLPLHRHAGDVRLQIQKALAEDIVPVEPCTGRYRFVNTTIRGDGKRSSFVTTVPVEILGTVTLEAGAKWHVAAERGTAPFVGGGTVVVSKGAALLLGIDADLRFDGTLDVRRGGTLAIPRHATIAITNHTLALRPGSTLHVDGALRLGERRGGRLVLDVCGLVDGIGRVAVDREGALRCSFDEDGDRDTNNSDESKKSDVREALLDRLRRRGGRH